MFLCFILVVSLAFNVLAENIDFGEDKPLINTIIRHAAACASQAKLKYDVCLEIVNEGNDNSQPKYDDCKCAAACVSKKMKTMSSDGVWDPNKVQEYIDNLKTEKLKNEADSVFGKCKNDLSTGCEGAYKLTECAFQNSEMMRQIIKQLLTALSGKMKN